MWSASRPHWSIAGEGSPSTHQIGGSVNPRVSMDALENIKFLAPAQNYGLLSCHPGNSLALHSVPSTPLVTEVVQDDRHKIMLTSTDGRIVITGL